MKLYPGSSASDFVNKFLNQYRLLEKIPGEGLSKTHAIQKFLGNIKDKEYNNTISFCRNNNCDLDTCVFKIRMHERELIRERGERRHLRGMVRRLKNEKRIFSESDDEYYNPSRKIRQVDNESNEFLYNVSPRGKLNLNSSDWSKMPNTQ